MLHEWGDPRQPARPPARLRAALETTSRKAGAGGAARYCPTDWKGGFVLLVMIFVLVFIPRQHRAALIRRRDRAHRVPRESAHRYLAASSPRRTPGARGSVVGDTPRR